MLTTRKTTVADFFNSIGTSEKLGGGQLAQPILYYPRTVEDRLRITLWVVQCAALAIRTRTAANEPGGQFSIEVRMGDMRDMASTDDCLNLRSGKRVGDLGDHRSKHWGAQVSGCEERRFRKRDDALKIEGKLLRIIHLVEKSWSVFREDLSGLGWELRPRHDLPPQCDQPQREAFRGLPQAWTRRRDRPQEARTAVVHAQ
ncbi:MAG: hypothetical protein K0Q60_5000 [Microvirga sp.]|nr:hypothetical protein [Microvirga sp.]